MQCGMRAFCRALSQIFRVDDCQGAVVCLVRLCLSFVAFLEVVQRCVSMLFDCMVAAVSLCATENAILAAG